MRYLLVGIWFIVMFLFLFGVVLNDTMQNGFSAANLFILVFIGTAITVTFNVTYNQIKDEV